MTQVLVWLLAFLTLGALFVVLGGLHSPRAIVVFVIAVLAGVIFTIYGTRRQR